MANVDTLSNFRCPFESPPVEHEDSYLLLHRDLELVRLTDPLKSERHIRLLLIQGSEVTHDDVVFEVFQVPISAIELKDPLEDACKSTALSYRWGDDTSKEIAYCGHDRIEVPIRRGLHQALRRIRFAHKPRVVWADAICIDQANTEEKNSQVRLMSEIYSNALVCVWLAAGYDEVLERVMSEFLKLLWKVGESFADVNDAPITGLRRRLRSLAHESGVDDPMRLPWIELAEFLKNEYFSRVWIVQELVLAPRVAIYSGRSVFPLSYLYRAHRIRDRFAREGLESGNERYQFVIPDHLDYDARKALRRGAFRSHLVVLMSANKPRAIHKSPPYYVVELLEGQICTDPRDKIYGLASLFTGGPAYPVKYELTPVEVFAEFTVHCIRVSQDLKVLSLSTRQSAFSEPSLIAEHREGVWLEGLPSWCNDWNGPQSPAREIGRADQVEWCASGTIPVTMTTSSLQELGLSGKIVGQIRCSEDLYCDGLSENIILELQTRISAFRLWRMYVDSLFVLSYTTEEEDIRCIIPRYSDDASLESIKMRLAKIWSAKFAPKLHQRAGIKVPKGRRSERSRIADAVMDLIYSWNEQVKVFACDSGYLGSGLSGAQTGDQLCILYGGKLPYIVRPHEDGKHYTFICEAYVPGLMHGEALKMDLPDTEFLLV